MKKLEKMIFSFIKTEKAYSGNDLKIIYYIQTWPSDVKKLKTDCCTHFWNYYQMWQTKKLSTWLLSSGQDFGKNFLDSKHVLKVYFNPSRKNPDFLFLPFPSEPVWLKIRYLSLHWVTVSLRLDYLNFKYLKSLKY